MQHHYNPTRVWIDRKKSKVKRNSRSKFGLVGNIFQPISSYFDIKNPPTPQPKLGKKLRQNKIKSPAENQVDSSKFKIFKPSQNALIKEKLNSALHPSKNQPKKFTLGFATPRFLSSKLTKSDWSTALWFNFKLQLTRWRLGEKTNRIIGLSIITSLAIFFLYLCFFDTYFLVKNYTVTFSQDEFSKSYISSKDMNIILSDIKENKFLGFIPNNQLWFLSDQNLTLSAQANYPEIAKIQVVRRYWPNSAEIKVTTQPVLVTLGINNKEYWRISTDGKVLSLDEAGLRENLVIVERNVSFNRPEKTLQDYSFQDNPNNQLNRFWFIIWLWNELKEYDLQIVKTTLPSLFDFDVNIELNNGTKLFFNSNTIARDQQSTRIQGLFDTSVKQSVKNGEVKYIDFRIPKKVFLCKVNAGC